MRPVEGSIEVWRALYGRAKTIAVLGAGAAGTAVAVGLVHRGHAVRLWSRSRATLEPFLGSGRISYEGVLGRGSVAPKLLTTDLPTALEGADSIVVSMPSLGHEHVARALVEARNTLPVVLNPGQTGSALRFRALHLEASRKLPPLAEFSTLTYVARKYSPGTVTVSGIADRVRVACLPGGEDALALACELFPSAKAERDVLATALANVNLVLHPPGAILGAAWVEATGGDFRFYVDGVTPAVSRVMQILDEERRGVASAFGHELPPLIEEMARIGTADRAAAARGDWIGAITGGRANQEILAPNSLDHRYYAEDFGYGIVPFLALAETAGVETPVASALLQLASVLLGRELADEGLTAARLGIAGLDRAELLQLVRGTPIAGGPAA